MSIIGRQQKKKKVFLLLPLSLKWRRRRDESFVLMKGKFDWCRRARCWRSSSSRTSSHTHTLIQWKSWEKKRMREWAERWNLFLLDESKTMMAVSAASSQTSSSFPPSSSSSIDCQHHLIASAWIIEVCRSFLPAPSQRHRWQHHNVT